MTNPDEPSFMPVLVTKTSRIANPVVFDVYPLTVEMARANTPPAPPDNIPIVNPFSPPFAGNVHVIAIRGIETNTICFRFE